VNRATSFEIRKQIWLVWLVLAAAHGSAQGASAGTQELASVLERSGDARHGKEIFDTCAACHGEDGAGQKDGTVPAIAAQHFRVIASALVNFRHEERRDERMEHFSNEHHLSGPQEIADVATYISRLRPTRSLGHGDGHNTELGAGIYRRRCASCHGSSGEGNERKSYPRLAGQHYEYLLRQLRDTGPNARPTLSAEHVRPLRALNDNDLVAICDYLSRLGK
jgi:cytochrome c553